MTYRKLLAAIRRAEELERAYHDARDHASHLSSHYFAAKRDPRRNVSSPTVEAVDDADASARSADDALDEEIDWESL